MGIESSLMQCFQMLRINLVVPLHLQQNFHMTVSVSLYYRFKAPLASRALPEVAVIMVITGATLLP